jgi:outer membrane protein
MRVGLYVFTVVFLAAVAGNAGADEKELALIGAGGIISTSPYRGVDHQTMLIPILRWDYKDFYVNGIEAGYRFFKADPVRLSVLVAPRFMGYHSSDSDALAGMEDRDRSLDAGIRADIALPWEGVSLGAKVSNDVLSRNDGREMELSLSWRMAGRIWRLIPSAGVRVQSSRMVDYYYGIRSDEVRSDRPAYDPGTAVNYFAHTIFSFGISQNWSVVTRVGVEVLSPQVTKSPIVNKDYLMTGLIGLARRF